MSTFTAREAKNRFGEMLEESQRQEVTVTRNGRPFALVRGINLSDSRPTVSELQAQQRTLLSFLGVASATTNLPSPEERVRSLREEW